MAYHTHFGIANIVPIVNCSKLKRLRAFDLPLVQHKQLTGLLLEEVLPAGCVIEGIDFTDTQQDTPPVDTSLPAFLKHYEDFATAAAAEELKAYNYAKQESAGGVKKIKE